MLPNQGTAANPVVQRQWQPTVTQPYARTVANDHTAAMTPATIDPRASLEIRTTPVGPPAARPLAAGPPAEKVRGGANLVQGGANQGLANSQLLMTGPTENHLSSYPSWTTRGTA